VNSVILKATNVRKISPNNQSAMKVIYPAMERAQRVKKMVYAIT
jgi:transposase-like protein